MCPSHREETVLAQSQKRVIPPRSAVVVSVERDGDLPNGEVAILETRLSLAERKGISTGYFILDPRDDSRGKLTS